MTAQTLEKAVVGRRVLFTRYSDLGNPNAARPGIITALVPTQGASVKIRLDGERNSLHTRPDYQGLVYLDEVTDVPALPMGRFHPTPRDLGDSVHHGVPVCQFEDGTTIALTDDKKAAVAAMNAYIRDLVGVLYVPDVDTVTAEQVKARWAVFEWEPEDAESPWTARWDASEGDDMAIRIHYLPA